MGLSFQLPVKPRVIVVSNRGPLVWAERCSGTEKKVAVSGLVSALLPLFRTVHGVWVAWGGRASLPNEVGFLHQEGDLKWQEVPLTEEELRLYYDGFSNQVLWPLCHYFTEKCAVEPAWWEGYKAVNKKFAFFTRKVDWGADLIWIHDYHLALLPALLRQRGNEGKMPRIGFFWHIPFPGPDLWEIVPWAKEIIEGLLGADFIGFHTPGYVENFLRAATAFTVATALPGQKGLIYRGREVTVKALPVGVDHEFFAGLSRDTKVREQAKLIRAQVGTEKICLGVERLDYSKGVLERLVAFERFLEENPAYRGRVSLIQIGVPTRAGVGAYEELRRRVEDCVNRINSRFGRSSWTPVWYLARAYSQRELAAFYLASDVAIVTPLRDGLNLVAAEYVLTRSDTDPGVLVLSRLAGIAHYLREALLVNPFNIAEMAAALRSALEMPAAERRFRQRTLRQRLARRTASAWVRSFLQLALEEAADEVFVG
ncbi:trehalose 6-phosphate synthase [Thermodesulfitimonas autotrophica]|uniref:Trehalose 6-phosphate synthase n=1 Tax=Thermodesulfitimonas autotrophica TaxID=1894989 RepID=A0A3N5AXA0_9THEO|nr:trehalose-6-phosphate synthase [Thermodesulfitimonas autotrophica]RPF49886.1 trehalose 6-phosphate synthase [Thermodesulfitimonas autotrophica]